VEIKALDSSPYEEKLLRALRHPEQETRMRAVEILGQLRTQRAVPSLQALLYEANDPYLIGGIIRALAAIEGKSLIEEIGTVLQLERLPVYVEQTARRALRQLMREAEAKAKEK